MDYLNSIYSIHDLKYQLVQPKIKIDEGFFKAPVIQIKEIKSNVDDCLSAVKHEQKLLKNREAMKPPMINRFIVSQMQHTYETIKEK